ncbi:hypothetical protein DL764_010565 [Monosporascus ibericus]|uniref:Asl1-like glycosyl hydrolase catalytic domain-containing protein n=1 Tax=Monosporascus ibericus TaxID=155417 RepID=A0A4Q4SV20_9PEZI|nr:hypothetical protein DL764_010565 [Monosporascus ibericus]
MMSRRLGMEIAKLLSLASAVAATDLFLPLYNAPGTNGAAWASVREALVQHPDVSATIVINVNNGPGNGPPTADWIAGGQALGSLPNVNLIGYVHSVRCQRPVEEVQADVTAWADWRLQDVSINGIFVDEAPNDGNCTSYMSGLTAHIRDVADLDVVVYNPGFPATPFALEPYYDLDPTYISALETCFATETNGRDLCDGPYTVYDQGGYGTTIDSTLRDWVGVQNYQRTAILIHGYHDTNGLYTANDETLSGLLRAVVDRGIGAAVFTTNHWITPDAEPADIGTMVSLLSLANM